MYLLCYCILLILIKNSSLPFDIQHSLNVWTLLSRKSTKLTLSGFGGRRRWSRCLLHLPCALSYTSSEEGTIGRIAAPQKRNQRTRGCGSQAQCTLTIVCSWEKGKCLRCLNRSRVCKSRKAMLALCWVPGRPHPGHCVLLQAPRFTKGMAQLERVQRKGRTVRGLKTTTCEGRLNTVGLFALKRRLRGDMRTAFRHIKGCSEEERNNLFSMPMTKRTGRSWQQRRFKSQIRKSLFNSKTSQTLEQTGKNHAEFLLLQEMLP